MKLAAGVLIASIVYAATPADDLIERGVALARAQQYDEAARVLENGRRRFPDDARFALELAGVEYRRHELNRAKAYLRHALRIMPDDRYANEFLAGLYYLDGNIDAAVKYWNRVERPVISSVRFVPAPRLQPVLIARIPAVGSGQILTLERLERTRANLDALQVFSGYNLELTPARDKRYDLTIHSSPRGTQGTRFWWRVLPFIRGLPYQQVNADFYNVRGTAINVTSLWRWDPDKRRVAISFADPRYRITVDARDEQWDLRWASAGEVRVRRVAIDAETTYSLTDRIEWTPGIAVLRREFPNLWLPEIRNRFDARLLNWPERRVQIGASAQLRVGQIVAAERSRFAAADADGRVRWFPQPRGERYQVEGRVRAGAMSGDVPVDELYMLGMERDNDLWLRGHVGTYDGRKGNSPLGRRYFLVNMTLYRELWRVPFLRVDAGPFFDTGSTGGAGRLGSRGALYDTGVELRVATVGGVRVSAIYGRDLRDGRPAFYTAVSR